MTYLKDFKGFKIFVSDLDGVFRGGREKSEEAEAASIEKETLPSLERAITNLLAEEKKKGKLSLPVVYFKDADPDSPFEAILTAVVTGISLTTSKLTGIGGDSYSQPSHVYADTEENRRRIEAYLLSRRDTQRAYQKMQEGGIPIHRGYSRLELGSEFSEKMTSLKKDYAASLSGEIVDSEEE